MDLIRPLNQTGIQRWRMVIFISQYHLDTDKKNSTLGNKKLVKSKDVKSKNDSKQNIRISKKNSNLDIEEAMSLTGKENSKKPELISSKTSQDTPSPNLISPAATDLNDIFPEEDKQTVEDHTFFRTYQAKSKKETIQKSVNTQKTTSKPAAKTETQFLDITNHSSKSTRSKLAESPTKKHKTTLIDRELVQPISFRI
ncbi:hypothetical protein BC833DRAFT_610922 [Globomyces pollinis-pini]|nr:hypothetical protein BC833DRAFT_610922 [Globomyces pollinis-pini]